MIYFRGHIQALESQISYLKERLEKAEAEKREAAEATRGRETALLERISKAEIENRELLSGQATTGAFQAHIDTLKVELDNARLQANGLLDRLLAKNNVAPVTETPKPSAPDILAPFGATDTEIQDALKESWIREETAYIMDQLGCDEGTARGYAEEAYVAQHQVIKAT